MPDHNGANRYWTRWNMPWKNRHQNNTRPNWREKTKQLKKRTKKGSNRHKINGPHDLAVQAYGTASSMCLGVGSKWIRTLLSVISQVIYWNREYLKGNGCSRLLLFRALNCFCHFSISLARSVAFALLSCFEKRGSFEICSCRRQCLLWWWIIDHNGCYGWPRFSCVDFHTNRDINILEKTCTFCAKTPNRTELPNELARLLWFQ